MLKMPPATGGGAINSGDTHHQSHSSAITWEVFQGRETEDSWQRRDEQLGLLIHLFPPTEDDRDGAGWIASLRFYYHDILAILQSPRTQLVLTCCRCLAVLTERLSPEHFEPLADVTLSALLRVCASTKRILAAGAEPVLMGVFRLAPPIKTVQSVLAVLSDRNAALRQRVLETFLRAVRVAPERWMTGGKHAEAMERIILAAVTDATPAVRESAIGLLALAEAHAAALDAQV